MYKCPWRSVAVFLSLLLMNPALGSGASGERVTHKDVDDEPLSAAEFLELMDGLFGRFNSITLSFQSTFKIVGEAQPVMAYDGTWLYSANRSEEHTSELQSH